MASKVILYLCAILLVNFHLSFAAISMKQDGMMVSLEPLENGMIIEVFLASETDSVLKGFIGAGRDYRNISCFSEPHCQIDEHLYITIEWLTNGLNLTWVSDDISDVIEDCYYLNVSSNWYGGPQRYNQVWPLEKMTLDGNDPYVMRKADNFGIAERYWLSSNGAYLFLSDNTPLWIDQNNKNDGQVCFRAEATSPYINRSRVVLSYVINALGDPKTAHLDAVNNYLGRPEKHPDERMISQPIWTTWAKYKKAINDASVLEFGSMIREHKYEGGQLEIDDKWETCYGSQVFDTSTFSDINTTITALHNDGWRVSLWVHPFVNDDCQDNSDIGKASNYFVRNPSNETNAVWWNGDNAHQIDFTNPEATAWWSDRLKNIMATAGVDSFKFDAGEIDYANQPGVFEDIELSPNILNQKYIEACDEFGDLIEVRSSFRGQKYGKFVRMLDKDSVWGINDGLASLVTTLLQLNMNGYVMVLPDMIGGNGYQVQPDGELILRWTQANTFMPTMQFSYLPWDYASEVSYDIEGIVKKYVDLHNEYAPLIISAMNKSIADGSPVNPPIWWVDPTDPIALANDDEYLLGEEILVAPILEQGATSRKVYLPKGQWKDGNHGIVYEGPLTIDSYPAPYEVLPYFIKQ